MEDAAGTQTEVTYPAYSSGASAASCIHHSVSSVILFGPWSLLLDPLLDFKAPWMSMPLEPPLLKDGRRYHSLDHPAAFVLHEPCIPFCLPYLQSVRHLPVHASCRASSV